MPQLKPKLNNAETKNPFYEFSFKCSSNFFLCLGDSFLEIASCLFLPCLSKSCFESRVTRQRKKADVTLWIIPYLSWNLSLIMLKQKSHSMHSALSIPRTLPCALDSFLKIASFFCFCHIYQSPVLSSVTLQRKNSLCHVLTCCSYGNNSVET